jgi:hypothetical protein
MLVWQGNKSRIQKMKLHFCIAYRIAVVGLGSQHGYSLSYAFQEIGSSGRDMSSLGPSLELWCHHYRV